MSEVRLIDANALKDKIGNKKLRVKSPVLMSGLVEMQAEALREIDVAPTIEAEPVKHGQWIMNNPYGIKCCSECGYGQSIGAENYCPNCGAKMHTDHIADVSKKVGGTDNDDSM